MKFSAHSPSNIPHTARVCDSCGVPLGKFAGRICRFCREKPENEATGLASRRVWSREGVILGKLLFPIMSQLAVAKELGVSAARAQQLEAVGLGKLKRGLVEDYEGAAVLMKLPTVDPASIKYVVFGGHFLSPEHRRLLRRLDAAIVALEEHGLDEEADELRQERASLEERIASIRGEYTDSDDIRSDPAICAPRPPARAGEEHPAHPSDARHHRPPPVPIGSTGHESR